MSLLSEVAAYRCGVVSWKLHRHGTDEFASRKQTTTNTQGASADGIITDWTDTKMVRGPRTHTRRDARVLRIKRDRLYTLALTPLSRNGSSKQRSKNYSSQRFWVTGRKGEKRLKEKDGVAPSKGRDSVSLLLPAAWQLKLRGRSSSPSASF